MGPHRPDIFESVPPEKKAYLDGMGPASGRRGMAAELTPTRARVWVVDDSHLEAERACRLLGRQYDAESFVEGAALLERLSEGDHPDLILLDWQMPGVSGLEVCQFLRERYDEVSLPILMLTSRGAKKDFTEGLLAGANDYVAKPYDDAELLARVRTLVRTRQQARAMREREAWFATTLSSIADAVIATDPSGHVTFFNQAAEKLTGWTGEEALGRPVQDVFTVIDQTTGLPAVPVLERLLPPRVQHEQHEHVQQEVLPLEGQPLLVRRDGTQLPIEDSVAPIGASRALGAVVVFRDATERTRAAAEAARRADFEEKLIGIVSHDLRNPLNVIALGAQALLRGGELDQRTSRTAIRIGASAENATRLVNDLLDFTQARLGNGIPVRRQPVELHAVVHQAVDEILAAYPEREVVVSTTGDARGQWDSDRLVQVLTNLVANALKYGQADGVVSVRCMGEGEAVTLTVHNVGTPIAPQLLPVLFEPMRRGTILTERHGRSVGLGLYIVKQIIDAHGGSVTLRSNATEGTTFEVTLPRH
jgi:PAS domain S-box-containing protein